MGAFRSVGPVLIGFALLTPLLHAALGLGLAHAVGMSLGGAIILATLAASASDPPPPEWSALWYGFSAWRTDRCRGSDPSLRRSLPSCGRRTCWSAKVTA
ncbi:hypothetical protein DK389_19680 [Methylobacterium durans]|uniref:Uncharacterized protein n=1 Tax=Methylobacterium durans TaxID=2202825 RepID=A0A2U8W857_9HYPH|nr:hypothetical protein DK389_19680 [Methylobacterium durans]